MGGQETKERRKLWAWIGEGGSWNIDRWTGEGGVFSHRTIQGKHSSHSHEHHLSSQQLKSFLCPFIQEVKNIWAGYPARHFQEPVYWLFDWLGEMVSSSITQQGIRMDPEWYLRTQSLWVSQLHPHVLPLLFLLPSLYYLKMTNQLVVRKTPAFILFSIHNRIPRGHSRVTPREGSRQDRNSLSWLNWASSVELTSTGFYATQSGIYLREVNQMRCNAFKWGVWEFFVVSHCISITLCFSVYHFKWESFPWNCVLKRLLLFSYWVVSNSGNPTVLKSWELN